MIPILISYLRWSDPTTDLAVSPEGVPHFGFWTHDDLGGTLGPDLDVLHTTLPVADPLIFADGFESGTSP